MASDVISSVVSVPNWRRDFEPRKQTFIAN